MLTPPHGIRAGRSSQCASGGSLSLFTVVVDGGEGKYQEVFSSPGYDAFPCWVRSEKH